MWLTYRLGANLVRGAVALLGAAQLACRPMHVRESHFVLTDVPMTALTTLAVWLAVRAGTAAAPRRSMLGGRRGGLAAAAKYNGGIVLVASLTAWVLHDRGARDRLAQGGGAIAGAAVAFLVAAPYTILDLPAFLNGFAAQFSRFAGAARHDDPGWWLYFKHLSLAARYWPPLAMVGAVLVCARRSHRRWLAPLIFVATYYYVLSTNSIIFGRYALPLDSGALPAGLGANRRFDSPLASLVRAGRSIGAAGVICHSCRADVRTVRDRIGRVVAGAQAAGHARHRRGMDARASACRGNARGREQRPGLPWGTGFPGPLDPAADRPSC